MFAKCNSINPENVYVCGNKSGCVDTYSQILPASYFHLQNHGTSRLAFCPPKIHTNVSRIPRATSYVPTIPASFFFEDILLMTFVCQLLKEDNSPSATFAHACCEDTASALYIYTVN